MVMAMGPQTIDAAQVAAQQIALGKVGAQLAEAITQTEYWHIKFDAAQERLEAVELTHARVLGEIHEAGVDVEAILDAAAASGGSEAAEDDSGGTETEIVDTDAGEGD